MAEQDPLFVNIDNVYGPDEVGRPYRDLIGEGVVEQGDLEVTQNGTPNMSVNVAAGVAWVRGDHSGIQPTYQCYNDATVNLSVPAADPTDPRKDIVVAEVLDDIFSGVSKLWRLRLVAGTPDPAPAEPSLPLSAHKLAVIDVGAGVSSIVDANITDARKRAIVGGGLAQASGQELAYQQITSDASVTGTGEVDVLSSGALEYDGSPIIVEFWAVRVSAGGAGLLRLEIKDGSAYHGQVLLLGTNGQSNPVYIRRRIVPTPGTHTFKVIGQNGSAQTSTVSAGAGNADNTNAPAFIRVSRA